MKTGELRKINVTVSLALAGSVALLIPIPQASAAPSPEVTLHVLTWDSGSGLTPYKLGIAQFEKIHPNIKVVLTSDTSAYYNAKLLTELANGTAPDVFLVADDAAEFARSGLVENITKIVNSKQFGIKKSNFFPSVFKLGMVDGQDFYIPKDWSDLSVIYNKAMFRKAHLSLPKAGWTMAQFLQDARKLTIKKNGRIVQWGAQMQGTWLRAGLEEVMASYGAQPLNSSYTSAKGELDSAKAKAAIKWFVNTYTKYNISPSPTEVTGFGNIDLFSTKRVAMEWTGPWNISTYREDKGLKFGVAPMPVGPGGKQVTEPMIGEWGVYSKSPHLQAANEFLGYMSSQDWAKIDSAWAMPALKGVAVNNAMKKNPYLRPYFQQANHLAPLWANMVNNWTKDVQAPLQNMLETGIEKPSTNFNQLVTSTVQTIDSNLKSDSGH